MKTLQDGTKVVWSPLEGSQTLCMSCPANIILAHGTRGPGKTDAQLMRFHRNVGVGYGKFWRGVIFDREYKMLDDLVSKSSRWFPQLSSKGRFLSSKSDYKWIWPTGEELLFRTIKKDEDYWNYHGQEYPFIGWNELTKFPSPVLFEAMMSCNRSSFLPEDYPVSYDGKFYDQYGAIRMCRPDYKYARKYILPDIPLEVFATTNPFGPGHAWVKQRFIDPAPSGKIVRTYTKVFNPRTQEDMEVVKTQVAIFGSYKENKYLSPEYVAELENITDPNKRAAWLGGDWDITSGGMFDDLWNPGVHVVKPFEIPQSWTITRSYDDGSAKPFSVGWWAESDGTDYIDGYGVRRSTLKGDLFRIAEWYGCVPGKHNTGLNLTSSAIAEGIVKRELGMIAGFRDRVCPGPADGAIFNNEQGNSVAETMKKMVCIDGHYYPGVMWLRANKSRIDGWKAVREYLQGALIKKSDDGTPLPRIAPGLYVFDTCVDFKRLFPSTPRDEVDMDDVDTDSEDHLQDEVRYMIASRALGVKGGRRK